jgi:hypothetical protein
LTLQFQPEFMGILPLYIVLLLAYAALLPIIPRFPRSVLAVSVALYLLTPLTGINLPTYPDGRWFHNPFAWQLLFVLGTVCATFAHTHHFDFAQRKPWFPLIVAFLAASVATKLTLMIDERVDIIPSGVVAGIWLFLDKTNLGPLRLLNFLALVVITVHLVSRDARFLRSAFAQPVILCGQNSLYIFCLGILLSYLGHLVLVEISHELVVQFLVSLAGCGVMIAVAAVMQWAKSQARSFEGRPAALGRGPVVRQGGE